MAENNKHPTTIKEALIAELLSDLNVVIKRTDDVIHSARAVDDSLNNSTKALIIAGEKYKIVINKFTEDAKTDISDHLKQNTVSAIKPLLETLTEQNISFTENGFKQLKRRQNIILGSLSILIALNLFFTVFLVFKLIPVW